MEHQQIGGHSFWSSTWPMGTHRKTLVLVHGAGQSAFIWQRQIDALGPHVNTVAVDLPGHGKSNRAGLKSVDAYADYLVACINSLKLNGVVICGHSMGGAVAQTLLLSRSSLFKGAVLVNTGARLRVNPDYLDLIQDDYDTAVDKLFEDGFDQVSKSKDMQERFRRICSCSARTALDDYAACDTFDKMDQVHAIRLPVLVIGSQNDLLTPLKYSRFLADQIPGARLRTVERSGHHAPLEKPEAVNQALVEFIESLAMDA